MPLWGNKNQPVTVNSTTTFESTKGAPIGTYVHVKGDQISRKDGANAHFGNNSPGSRADVDYEMFNSHFFNEFMPNQAVGVFGVYANSGSLNNPARSVANNDPEGELIKFTLVNGGTGYSQATKFQDVEIVVTFANGYVSNSIISGHLPNPSMQPKAGQGIIDSLNTIVEAYDDVAPFVDVAPPEVYLISANSKQLTPNGFAIYYATGVFAPSAQVYYSVPEGNTPIAPLKGNTWYYCGNSDFDMLKLRETPDGPEILITDPRINSTDQTPEVHSLQGIQAQVIATIPNPNNIGSAHAGWVLQREFKGGRAGRIQTEVLVAMSSLEEGIIPPPGHRPEIYTISPSRGTVKGGEQIVITGRNFISEPNRKNNEEYTKVFFGNTPATNVVAVNSEYVTATIPPADKPKTTDVIVATTDGGSRVGPNTKFTYIVTEPYIVELKPNRAGYLGGDTIQIIGANFSNIRGISIKTDFGVTIDVPNYQVVDSDNMLFVTPPISNRSANGNVIVSSNDHGNSDISPATLMQFYDARAVVTNLNPANSGMDGGLVTITGREFQGTNKVWFGNQEAQFTYVNGTYMTATAPSVTRPGIVDVILRDNYGNSTPDVNSKFQYFAPLPEITSIRPEYISTWVQTNVVIEGNNLWDTNQVSWDRIPYFSTNSEIQNINGSITTVKSPVTDSDGITTPVYVTTPTGRSISGYNINYVKVPLIFDMSTHEDDYRGGTNVSVTGLNFLGATEVGIQRGVFGTKYVSNSFNVVNNNFMTFITPAVTDIANNYYVYVVGPKGSTVQGGDTNAYFDYVSYTPIVSAISINAIPYNGWVDIGVTGKNFTKSGNYSVYFGEGAGAYPANDFKVINNTSMIVYSPNVVANLVGQQSFIQVRNSKYGESPQSPNNIITWANLNNTIKSYNIDSPGSGYSGNNINIMMRTFATPSYQSNVAVVAIPEHGGAVNTANKNGQIVSVTPNTKWNHVFNNPYAPTPTLDVDPPEKYTFPANNKGFNTDGFALWGAYTVFSKGDRVYYEVPYGNTAFAPLTGNTWYYVAENQLYFLKLSTTKDGPVINITDPRKTSTNPNAEVHFLQGETAKISAIMNT